MTPSPMRRRGSRRPSHRRGRHHGGDKRIYWVWDDRVNQDVFEDAEEGQGGSARHGHGRGGHDRRAGVRGRRGHTRAGRRRRGRPAAGSTTTTLATATAIGNRTSSSSHGRSLGLRGIPSHASSDADDGGDLDIDNKRTTPRQPPFSLPLALFLAGLAFDAYVEPPSSSSQRERGSSGLNVAFLSATYTRSLYRGIVEVTPLRATDLS